MDLAEACQPCILRGLSAAECGVKTWPPTSKRPLPSHMRQKSNEILPLNESPLVNEALAKDVAEIKVMLAALVARQDNNT
jgi:hypothetical protein